MLGHGASIVRNGLMLHLDAANSKSYPGSGTTWKDLSGNGNHGALTNSPTYNSSNSGSFVFDGTNNYTSTPSVVLAKPLTLSFFCLVNQVKNQGFYVSRTVGGKGISVFAIGAIAGSNIIRFDTGDDQWVTSYAVPLSKWVNIAVTLDEASKKLFIDGNLNSSYSFVGAVSNLGTTATVGCSQVAGSSYDNFLNGRVSQVQIYNRALSATEVKQNFEALRGRYGI